MSTTPEEMLSMLDGNLRTCVVCSEVWTRGKRSLHLSHCEVPKVSAAFSKAVDAAKREARAAALREAAVWMDELSDAQGAGRLELNDTELERQGAFDEAAEMLREKAEAT